jgi:ATP-dependent DNA helicase RecG
VKNRVQNSPFKCNLQRYIEDVERHGLAQLHQMRGRVGRGPRQSHCYLLQGDDSNGFQSRERLRVLEQTNNGVRIAENDLRQRGPGEFFGKKQSGTPISGLFHASVETDIVLLDHARRAAAETIARSNVRGEGLPAPLAVALRDMDPTMDLQV